MSEAKRALRAMLRARRAAVGRVTVPVAAAFAARLARGSAVAAYIPIGDEADPGLYVRAAIAAGCAILLPHVVDRATPLRFLTWREGDALIDGPLGLRQPPHDAAEQVAAIILTPLIGFDRRGNRIGQGAGHYDRAFAAHPAAWRIGIAAAVQEVDAIPPDPWDMPLHAIATEREWIES